MREGVLQVYKCYIIKWLNSLYGPWRMFYGGPCNHTWNECKAHGGGNVAVVRQIGAWGMIPKQLEHKQ